jgi:hypothetical protein
MSKSKMLTALIAVGAIVVTSMITPASAARRHVGENVVHLPVCPTCGCPLQLVRVVGKNEHGPVTRVFECARCHKETIRQSPTEEQCRCS